MKNIRKQHPPSFKAKIALEAMSNLKTSSQIASDYDIHPAQIRTWKSTLMKYAADLFSGKRDKKEKEKETLIESLYKKIGQLTVELEWLKKKAGLVSTRSGCAN